MSPALDPMRWWLRRGHSRSSQRDMESPALTPPEIGDAVQPLDYTTRRALGIVTVSACGAALVHQPLVGALAASHGLGVLGAAYAVLVWPVPLLQPVLAAVGALVLSMVGLQSRSWRQVTRRQCWYLLASAVVAVLGAGPTVLVSVLALVAIALAIMIAWMIFFGLLVLLLVARKR